MALTQISTGGVKNDAVTAGKIPADAVGQSEIADEAVDEARLQISNAGTNGQFLQKQSGNTGGLTWATVDSTPEGTVIKSTGESGTTKFLRVDGDGTSSWQVPPDTVYTHPNHSGEVTSSADGAQTIADDVVDEANLKISNAGTNGQFLQKQSGNTGGLTWADAGGGVDSDADKNTVGGTNAGDSITSGGENNTCFGYDAGTAITTADENTCIGSSAGVAYSGGGGSTLVGFEAGKVMTSGWQNTVLGSKAEYANETGSYNVMIGAFAGAQSGSHSWNTVVGYAAGYSLTGSTHNVCLGRNAGKYQTSGGWGVFIGAAAGPGTSTKPGTGNWNIAIGNQALHGQGGAAVSGGKNVMVGTYNGYYTSTSEKNTCIGHTAGQQLTTGDNNLLLGHEAGKSGSPSGEITTGDNIICLGDSNISALYCQDTSISASDSRDKADVTNFTHGLNWIKQLNPITYRWDKRSWYDNNTPDGSKKRNKKHIGFLAQDVLAIEGNPTNKDDMLVVNLNEDDTAYGLKYERLVPVLVNAIKELSAKVETLETKVAALEAK